MGNLIDKLKFEEVENIVAVLTSGPSHTSSTGGFPANAS